MKALVAACALVFGLASAATAGESAVTPDTLDQMGLAGMDTLSDSEGMTVRGKGPFGSFAGFGGLGCLIDDRSTESEAIGVGRGFGDPRFALGGPPDLSNVAEIGETPDRPADPTE